MAKYITTRKYAQTGLCGEYLVIHYGQELEENGGILYWNDKAVCAAESDNGFMHFTWNEDGHGEERGALTYAIAYGNNGVPYRFTDAENRQLRSKWGKYLRSLSDANIVNADLFRAPVETLMQIAEDLHLVPRKGRYSYKGLK